MVLAVDILPVQPVRYTYADRLFIRWVDQSDWPSSTKRICLKIFEQQRKHGQAYVFHRTLAEWLGLSVATVKRAIGTLVAAGVLEVFHQIRYDGGYGSNRYKVVPRISDGADLLNLDPTRKKRVATPVPDQNELPVKPGTHYAARVPEAKESATEKTILQKEINNSSDSQNVENVVVSQAIAEQEPTESSIANAISESRPATALSSILEAWATARNPHITPVPDQNELPIKPGTHYAARVPEAKESATEKTILQKEINNSSNSNDSSQSPVVVPHANALTLKNIPTGETPESPAWIKQLLHVGTQETIDRIIGWYKACPVNHPARPKYPAAWIYAGVRDNWQEPPTWIKQAPVKPPVKLRVLTDEEAAQQEAARREAQELYQAQQGAAQQEWEAIEAVLRANTSDASTFATAVHQHLLHQLGGSLGEAAWTSRGPTWRNACREVWRQMV